MPRATDSRAGSGHDKLWADGRMNSLYIALSIPVFFLLIGLETWVARRRGLRAYRFADSITNLSCGVGQQVLGVFLKGAIIVLYVLVYEQARLFEVSASDPWAWVALLLGVDFAYYWFHRVSHRMNLVWATHVVHHQSEEYNLSVALRQSALQGLWASPFYLPLALLGFPPLMFVGAKTINTLYQFWIHTRTIGKLGPLEWVLNTPSHHRIHHAINPRYIDKNYAGMLIVWDRLFGTFVEEREAPVYGTVKPLRSWNPLWANVDQWAHLLRMSRATRRWTDRLRVWVAPPEWRPDDLGGAVTIGDPPEGGRDRYDTPLSRALVGYVAVSFALAAAGTTWLLLAQDTASVPQLAAVTAVVLVALVGWGGLFERRRWARPLEAIRWVATVAVALWITTG